MDLRAVSGTDVSGATLTGWDPETHTEITQAVRSADDVRVAAGEFLERYRKAGSVLPGLELRAGVADGASLSIAVGPSEWALVHTDEAFDQRCTRGEDTAEGSADVSWDELTSIPFKWFVPDGEAAAAVDRWLGDGTLTSLLRWSEDCS